MRKFNFCFLIAGLSLISLSGCSNVNPNDTFINSAITAYKLLRQKQNVSDGDNYYAFYYDAELLKGVAFNSVSDYKYLGIINLQTFSFSESDDYYLDIPNYEISLDMNGDFDTGSILPSEISDTTSLIKTLPFVLVKNDEENPLNLTVYSRFDSEGNLSEVATADNYDPLFYYIKDFKYEIDIEDVPEIITDDFSIDYTGKYMAILKRDIITILEETLKVENFLANLPIDLDLVDILLTNYRKANNLTSDENLPSTINFPATFKNCESVVGPLGLFDYMIDVIYDDGGEDPALSSYHEIQNVTFSEGITEFAIFAFSGNENITSIELPSTIKKLSLSSLSNLTNLEFLYVPDTDEVIDMVNTYGMELSIDNPFSNSESTEKITICGPLQGTSLKNTLTFEHYDNINFDSFPLYDLILPEGKKTSDVVKFIPGSEVEELSSLSEGFYDLNLTAINPLFMMNLGSNPVISDEKFNVIESDQTLFLSHSKTKANNDLVGTSYENFRDVSDVSKEGSEVLTLKLMSDLEVSGNLIVGGVVGKNGSVEGDLVGNYAAIDLNGHELKITGNGLVDCNGKIYDSSSNKTGSIIVENSEF